MCSVLIRHPLSLAGALLAILAGSLCLAQQPAPSQPPIAPQTQGLPPAPPPLNQPAPLRPLDPHVQQVLAQAREAYKTLKTYQDLGSITTTITIGGRPAEAT